MLIPRDFVRTEKKTNHEVTCVCLRRLFYTFLKCETAQKKTQIMSFFSEVKQIEVAIGSYIAFGCYLFHVKHRKREPEGLHGQLEDCNRTLRPKAAVANNNHLAPNYSRGQVYYTSLNVLSKSGPNRSSSSRENAKKPKFLLLELP